MEGKQIKILAIDDNQDNLISLKALIKESFPDALTRTALNGEEGIEKARKENPDVILLDIIMPGMDGFETCLKLKAEQHLADIPVLFLTALKGDKESRIHALECGAEAFLTKPIDETELTAQIRAMIKIRAANYAKHHEKEQLAAQVAEKTRELKITHTATLNLLEDLKNEVEARKKSETELIESEKKYRFMFANNPQPMWIYDLETLAFLEVNNAAFHHYGYSKEEFLSMTLKDIRPLEDIEALMIDVKENAQQIDHTSSEWRHTKKNGELIFVEIVSTPVSFKGRKARHVMATDITERKKAAEALRESEEKYRMIFENVQDVFYQTDLAGNVLEISPSIRHFSEFNREEILGQPVYNLYKNYEDREKLISELVKTGELRDYELQLKTKTGDIKTVSINASLIPGKNDKPAHIDGAIRDITERKQAQIDLKNSEQLFQTLAKVSPVGIFKTRVDGYTTYVNPKWLELSGLSFEKALGNGWLQAVHPDDRDKVSESWLESTSETKSSTSEYRFLRSDGTITWVMGQAIQEIDDQDQIVGYVGTITDISELKLQEKALHHRQDRARLQRNAIAGIAIEEAITNGERAESFKKLTEESAEALQVEYTSIWMLSEDNAVLKCELQFTRTTKKWNTGAVMHCKDYPGYFDAIRNENRIFVSDAIHDPRTSAFAEAYLIPMGITSMLDAGIYNKGELVGIFCFENTGEMRNWHSDEESFASTMAAIAAQTLSNHERKLLEIEVSKSEERYKNFISQVSEGVYRFELDEPMPVGMPVEAQIDFMYTHMIIAECNQAFMGMYGIEEASEIIGKNQIQLHGGTQIPENREALRQFILSGYHTENIETRELDLKGDIRFFSNNSVGIVKDGALVRTWGTQMDITARKHSEKELIAAKEKAEESDRLKSAFLANMSHEIRTPMNGILGFTELLKTPDLTGEEQQEYIRIIRKSGDRMLNIINDIVEISRIEAGQMKVVSSTINVNHKISDIFAFFKHETDQKGIQLIMKKGLPDNEAVIRTDDEKVYGILTNLIKNAIKFTKKGVIEIGYNQKDQHLEFYVKDTGTGIPPENMELIFERFRQGSESLTRNYEGAGLGLAISRSYVEILGGRIRVESEPGNGSVFYFTIPYNPVSEKVGAKVKRISGLLDETGFEKVKILIAEDDEISDLLMTTAVRRISSEILHARTGNEAIEACRINPDIDLVLMDIKMPDMDGYEATRQIRQFDKDVVIIAQTAYAMAGDREKALGAGCNEHLSKPVNQRLLIALIKDQLT